MFNFTTYAYFNFIWSKNTKNSRKYEFIRLQFTDHGTIEGVVPLELLPPDVWSKHQAKPNDKSKRAKKGRIQGCCSTSSGKSGIFGNI